MTGITWQIVLGIVAVACIAVYLYMLFNAGPPPRDKEDGNR